MFTLSINGVIHHLAGRRRAFNDLFFLVLAESLGFCHLGTAGVAVQPSRFTSHIKRNTKAMIQSRFRNTDVTARTSRTTIHAINKQTPTQSRMCFTRIVIAAALQNECYTVLPACRIACNSITILPTNSVLVDFNVRRRSVLESVRELLAGSPGRG